MLRSIILLLPALAALLLWQAAGPARVHPADLGGSDRISGFFPPEQSAGERIRWASPQARLELPAGGLPGVLLLRGALAPGAQVRVALAGAPPVALPPGGDVPRLRRYALLLPAQPDSLGWAELRITADPPAAIGGRELSMALAEARIVPVERGPRLPPLFAWLMLASLPALLALALALAGLPRRPALVGAALAGVLLAWIWTAAPELVHGPLLDLRAFFGAHQIWIWWLAAQLLGLLGWPLAARLLPGLPLAGYPLARPLGLLLVAWLAWLLSVAGILPFGQPSLIISILLVAAVAWLPWVTLPSPFSEQGTLPSDAAANAQRSPQHRKNLHPLSRLRERGLGGEGLSPLLPGILAYELLFAGGLFLGIWLRWHGAVGPALTGTEKPMEIAMLNAVLRYGQFPPLDPWLAGFDLNYYYLGYVLIGGMALLTGTSPALAFNLGFALVVALTIVGLAYLAHALVALSPDPLGRRPGRPARVGVALLALIACLALGSQAGALQLIVGSPLVRALDAGQLASALAQRMAGTAQIQLDRSTPPSWDGPPFATITPAEGRSFDWFMPSRAIYDDVALPGGGVERRYAIGEFPAFSLYLGDLHPHVLAMPFDLLALAAALAIVAGPRRGIAQLMLAGIVIGCLYCINSWDAPTYALIAVAALALAARRRPPARRWPGFLRPLATLSGAALLAALPFLLTFRPPAGPAGGATIALAQNHTRLHSFLIFFGLFILLAATLLIPRNATGYRLSAIGYRLSAIALALLLGLLLDFPLLFLLPLGLLLAARAWGQSASLGESLAAGIAAVGCLILLVPELVYIRDHLEGEMSRMITIFKFYYQAWLLLGIVAAYAVWAGLRRPGRSRAAWIWTPPAALLLAGALVYPLGLLRWAEPWRPAERTLDGLAFLGRERPAELAAARWMSANIPPDKVVLTGFCNSCDYEQATRAAAISGVQTVLGWMDGHERVWRSGYPDQLAEIAARERDIPIIYRAAEPALARPLLERYSVDYIYLGPVERGLYGESAAAFAADFPVAFRQGEISIYRVP